MRRATECPLSQGFSVWEKIYAQVSFFSMGVIGTIGIVLADWPWVLPYVGIYWYGILGVVMRHLNCPRCPHLHVYGDCLQAPARLTRWLVKKRKAGPFSVSEELLFWTIFLLIPTYPLFWLAERPVLLLAFLATAVAWYTGQLLYFCRRCRVYGCPFNRVRFTH